MFLNFINFLIVAYQIFHDSTKVNYIFPCNIKEVENILNLIRIYSICKYFLIVILVMFFLNKLLYLCKYYL